MGKLLENGQDYFLKKKELDGWSEMTICDAERGTLPLIFVKLQLFIGVILRIRRLVAPNMQGVVLGKYGTQ